MSNQLPESVLLRLHKDEVESAKQLSTGSLPEAAQTVKQSAERKLLSITGKAIDTLEEVMDGAGPKERVAAATAILDRSPATKPQISNQPTEQAIPLEAIKELFVGMGKMFGQVIDIQHTQIKRAEPEPIEAPEPKVAPKRGKHGKKD